MWGFLAALCFVIGLAILIFGKAPDMKYAFDFALAGGAFVGLAVSRIGGWYRGW
jgi:hypothetical protein